MTRSDTILSAAVVLFNRDGVANVRSRDVSDRLNISNGNLTYHFPTMAALVEAVVARILEEGQELNPVESTGPLTISRYFEIITNFVTMQRRYPFFFKDILELTRRFPAVGQIHREMLDARLKHSRQVIKSMIVDGTVMPEPIPGCYDRMNLTMLTNAIFWPTTEELLSGIDGIDFHPEVLLLDILYPHLTDKGKDEYNALLTDIPIP